MMRIGQSINMYIVLTVPKLLMMHEVKKVANPQDEESDVTDLITSTQVQRIKPHSKIQ